MQTRWASLGWSECELAGVKVVVLAWIAVDAFQRHVILEELVPPGGKCMPLPNASWLSRASLPRREAITRSIFAPIRWRL